MEPLDINSKIIITATIIRKDGSQQELGIISGGTRWDRIKSYVLIKFSNLVTRLKSL